MLILPPGHWQETHRARTAAPRERWIIAVGAGLLGLIAVVVVVSLTSVQKRSANGCIDVSAATAIGGSELYRCGSDARALCAQPGNRGTDNVAFRVALAEACRKAGLPSAASPRRS